MKSLLRSLVSAPKQTYFDINLNKELDLAYVTEQLIVSAAPVNSYVKSYYRNDIREIVAFLDTNHKMNDSDWHIWNFRGEDAGYMNVDVGGKVSHYPFPDHQAPSIDILIKSVKEIHKFLSSNPRNVAFLHCKAGKGRSGTVCCAYLMYKWYLEGKQFNPDKANDLFTKKRMKSFAGPGISILSQKRYLSYWYDYLNYSDEEKLYFISISNNMPNHEIFIDKLEIENLNYEEKEISDLKFKIEGYKLREDNPNGVEIVLIREVTNKFIITREKNNLIIKPSESIQIPEGYSDIRISVKGWCYFWFNLYVKYINFSNSWGKNENIPLTYSVLWEELDGLRGTAQKGIQRFSKLHIYTHFILKDKPLICE